MADNAKDCNIEEEFVRVQGVKTAVLKLGQLKEKDADGPARTLMLLIPGNLFIFLFQSCILDGYLLYSGTRIDINFKSVKQFGKIEYSQI